MTVASYHGPTGPAPDAGWGAMAAVARFMYATGPTHDEAGRTDEDRIAMFGAYVAGQGPPHVPAHRRRSRR